MNDPFWMTPEHADEVQLRHFRNRCILFSTAEAIAESKKCQIQFTASAPRIQEMASDLVQNTNPHAQTLEEVTAWIESYS